MLDDRAIAAFAAHLVPEAFTRRHTAHRVDVAEERLVGASGFARWLEERTLAAVETRYADGLAPLGLAVVESLDGVRWRWDLGDCEDPSWFVERVRAEAQDLPEPWLFSVVLPRPEPVWEAPDPRTGELLELDVPQFPPIRAGPRRGTRRRADVGRSARSPASSTWSRTRSSRRDRCRSTAAGRSSSTGSCTATPTASGTRCAEEPGVGGRAAPVAPTLAGPPTEDDTMSPADTPTLDLDLVRAQFPAFSDPDLDGWAFFENAGGSFPCRQVVDRLCGYYTHTKVQPGHPYPLSRQAAEAMAAGPARLSAWLGVDPDEVHVGPSTTQNTYVLAQAIRPTLADDAAVVITQQDHEANRGAWARLADAGVEVREWAVDPATGMLDPHGLDAVLDERVAVVAFPHVSNLVGHPNPVRDLCDRAHAAGALAVVDGVAAAPHGLPDVAALGADVYLFSTYKTYGPHQGVMVLRGDLATRLPNQGHVFNADQPGKRLVPAGPDHAQVAALAGVADYLDLVDGHHFPDAPADPAARIARVARLFRSHETVLLGPLLDLLGSRDDVRVIGPTVPADRVPTVSVVTRRPAAEVAARLAEHRVMAAGSHFYAPRLVESLGVDPAHGVLRMSFVHTTSPAEVDQLVHALEASL